MARASDPAAARRAALTIVERLRASGHIAYFAGGCVRDALLGLAPTDYDVATDATPARVRALFRRTQEVGAAFGVVLVSVPADGGPPDAVTTDPWVEVATFRADGPYTDARRPDSIVYSDASADAERRDFTINALFIDPLARVGPDVVRDAQGGVLGTVIDYVGGRADLEARLLRAVGDPDKRLADDHLRALRAVRFAARLGFAIDPATEAAITRHAASLRGVSRERIGDEVRRMLGHPSRAAAVAMLTRLGLDAPVLDAKADGPPKTPFEPTLLGLLPHDLGSGPPAMGVSMAAWAGDRHRRNLPGSWLPMPAIAPTVRQFRRALCLSNEESDALRGVLTIAAEVVGAWNTSTVAGRKRLAGRDLFPMALRMIRGGDRSLAEAVEADAARLAADGIGIAPEPVVTGDDLVDSGFIPGPMFKSILDTVYDAQLEGRVRDKAGGMELARRLNV